MKLNILRNPWVLGVMGILAAGNLGMHIRNREFDYCAILIISGAIASFFSRNMVVILTIAMVFTELVRWVRTPAKYSEGLEPDMPSSTEEPPATEQPIAATAPPPEVLEPDAPPTPNEKKLDDIQIKIDTIQTELSDLKRRL